MNLQQMALSFEPFRDAEGNVYILVPKSDSDELDELFLDTEEARDVIFWRLCKAHSKGRPNTGELRTALRAIRGLARSQPPREPADDTSLAHKPLAEAILAAARRGGTTKDDEALLAYLNRIAQEDEIDTTKCSPPWPESTKALGKQLGLLKPLLAAKGVHLTYHDTARPRKWTIPPLGGQKVKPGERDVEMAAPSPTERNSSSVPATSVPEEEASDDEILAQFSGDEHG